MASPGPPSWAIDPLVSGIAHAKVAKDTKGVIFNFGFLIFPAVAGRAHARLRADSSRKAPTPVGVEPQRSEGECRVGRDEWAKGDFC